MWPQLNLTRTIYHIHVLYRTLTSNTVPMPLCAVGVCAVDWSSQNWRMKSGDHLGRPWIKQVESIYCCFYFYLHPFLLFLSLSILPHTLSLPHSPSDTFGMSNTFSTSLTMTLVEAYRKIHDPDALQGVDQSVALSLQAMSYTHTG